MSSAINHAKRSHRSAYRTRGFVKGSRKSIGSVTIGKNGIFDLIRMIRNNRKDEK